MVLLVIVCKPSQHLFTTLTPIRTRSGLAPPRVLFVARKYRGGQNMTGEGKKNNPRSNNGTLRRKYRARFKAMGAPCGICGGRLGEIHYDEPSDYKHPLSFVIDEINPISRYKEFGYESRRAAAEDWNNLQASHYICNQKKSNHTMDEVSRGARVFKANISDGTW